MLGRQSDKTVNKWVWVGIPGSSVAIMVVASLSGHPLAGSGAAVIGLCAFAAWWNPDRAKKQRRPVVQQEPQFKVASDTDSLIRDMLAQGRSALLVRDQTAKMLDAEQQTVALESLHKEMALVPSGEVYLQSRAVIEHPDQPRDYQILQVDAYYLDRYTVTNEQFYRFVEAGGYQQANLWDEEVSPDTFDFLDQTGALGPRFWRDGKYLVNSELHPVVGITWYEARAYSRWVGKRLPTDPEWVKAGAWPIPTSSVPKQRKYPWGDQLDADRANLWDSDIGRTVPVTEYIRGASAAGHHQLVGNVWEWTCDEFGQWDSPQAKIHLAVELRAIRGAAFDTYFETESNCQFQSGEYPLSRRHNIGFRCALSATDLSIVDPEDPASEVHNEDNNQPQGTTHTG